MIEFGGTWLGIEELTLQGCLYLGYKLREGDKVDCWRHDQSGCRALKAGMEAGPAWGVWDLREGSLIGAIGWNTQGNIWSLWSDLTGEQTKEVMHLTVPAIRSLVSMAGGIPLGNYVWEGNRLTIAWLKASHCFNFLDDRIRIGDKDFIPFKAKPYEELPCV